MPMRSMAEQHPEVVELKDYLTDCFCDYIFGDYI